MHADTSIRESAMQAKARGFEQGIASFHVWGWACMFHQVNGVDAPVRLDIPPMGESSFQSAGGWRALISSIRARVIRTRQASAKCSERLRDMPCAKGSRVHCASRYARHA